MTTQRIDIHDYDRRLATTLRLVSNSDLSLENKKALEDFANAQRLAGLGSPRITKYVGTMRMVGLGLRKNFRAARKHDLEQFMLAIKARADLSPWTKRDYAVTLRKFYSWLQGDGKKPPEKVACISGALRKKDQPRIKKAELLTEQDVQALLCATRNTRDGALVSMLWDTGARIGELGSMTVGDITFKDQYTLLDLRGKTGPRTVLACESTRALLAWLDIHPDRANPAAPLWVPLTGKIEPLKYAAIRSILITLFERAGVRKRYNPHLFRHSRASWCVEVGGWSTYELCRHFGWELDSGMPAVYLSLSDKFVHDKMLRTYGIVNSEQEQARQRCARCGSMLAPGRKFCANCGMTSGSKPKYEALLREEDSRDKLADALRDDRVRSAVISALRELDASQEREHEGVHPGTSLPPLPPIPGTSASIPEGGPSSLDPDSLPDPRPVVSGSHSVSSRVLRGKATSPEKRVVV